MTRTLLDLPTRGPRAPAAVATMSPLLDSVSGPGDVRRLPEALLSQLADELRHATIASVARSGGHLGAGLGVVELTVALHYAFETPRDIVVWDVGHQAYPHKILTGRRARMDTLRQAGGLSGFTRRAESPYDAFGAGHAGTSISAALGFCAARDLAGRDNHVVAVIGDGSVSAGMALEAINNAASVTRRLIVILNDNGMSIAPAVGAVSEYLHRRVRGAQRNRLRPRAPETVAGGLESGSRASTPCIFRELGFQSLGPVDGHDLTELLQVLEQAKQVEAGPVLIHVVTEKGRGFRGDDLAHERFHSVTPFDLAGARPPKRASSGPATYTHVFAETLIKLARKDERITAITAAMPSGTGVAQFAKVFPRRSFDVGIAEQHAVTFAAGMAADGAKPFVAIYSTFLQRAYDQVVHDVALQKLPVRFVIDRAGLVGADGPTHAGAFDLVYLMALPNLVIMAPSDEGELASMLATAAAIDDAPSAIRFPRGSGRGVDWDVAVPLAVGRGRVVRQGRKIAILSIGSRLPDALLAAELLEDAGHCATVVDARFAKPLDEDLIEGLAAEHEVMVTVEEGAAGGFGAAVARLLAERGHLDGRLKVRTLTLPDRFQEHGAPEAMIAEAGLDANSIAAACISLVEARAAWLAPA